MIGETQPILPEYEPPSPLRLSVGGKDTSKKDDLSQILGSKDQAIDLDNVHLNVVYADQSMSHRFVRVCLSESEVPAFNSELTNYIKRLEEEDSGLKYYNTQEDGSLYEMVGILAYH